MYLKTIQKNLSQYKNWLRFTQRVFVSLTSLHFAVRQVFHSSARCELDVRNAINADARPTSTYGNSGFPPTTPRESKAEHCNESDKELAAHDFLLLKTVTERNLSIITQITSIVKIM